MGLPLAPRQVAVSGKQEVAVVVPVFAQLSTRVRHVVVQLDQTVAAAHRTQKRKGESGWCEVGSVLVRTCSSCRRR